MKYNFLMNSRKEKAAKILGIKKPAFLFGKEPSAHSRPGYKKVSKSTEMATDAGVSKRVHKNGVSHKYKMPIKKAFGGPMPQESPEVASRIEDANQILRSASGLKKGGVAHHKPRVCKASGGPLGLSQMANRDLEAGKAALGFKRGGDIKMVTERIRKPKPMQMLRAGKATRPSFSHKCYKDK